MITSAGFEPEKPVSRIWVGRHYFFHQEGMPTWQEPAATSCLCLCNAVTSASCLQNKFLQCNFPNSNHWLPMCWFLGCMQHSVFLYISSRIVSLSWLKKNFFFFLHLGFSALSSPLSSSHFFWNGITVPFYKSFR